MKKNETILFSKIKNLNSINQKIKKIKNPPFFYGYRYYCGIFIIFCAKKNRE